MNPHCSTELNQFAGYGPYFLCIGAQRAGTTWLYQNLRHHPAFRMPPHKEIHYFNNKGKPGLSIRSLLKLKTRLLVASRLADNIQHPSFSKLKWDLRYLLKRRTDRWYLSLLTAPAGKLTGDISPAYSTLDESTVHHIVAMLPTVKVIFILRNPIARAWSHAKMDFQRFQRRHVSDVTHEALVAHFESAASRLRTDYARTLSIWDRFVPADRFLTAFFDDLVAYPKQFFNDVLAFLGVEPETDANERLLLTKINDSGDDVIPPRSRDYLAAKYGPAIYALRRRFGARVEPWLDNIGEMPSST